MRETNSKQNGVLVMMPYLILNMDMTSPPNTNVSACIILGFLLIICLACVVYIDIRR